MWLLGEELRELPGICVPSAGFRGTLFDEHQVSPPPYALLFLFSKIKDDSTNVAFEVCSRIDDCSKQVAIF